MYNRMCGGGLQFLCEMKYGTVFNIMYLLESPISGDFRRRCKNARSVTKRYCMSSVLSASVWRFPRIIWRIIRDKTKLSRRI